MIVVEKLFKSYRRTQVLQGIDHRQKRGEVVVLIGPSGCGKSTFLRCLNQLEIADSGRITIGDVSICGGSATCTKVELKNQAELRLRIGMVFQSFNLFPHLTALQNITKAPVVVKGMRRLEAEDIARKRIGWTFLAQAIEAAATD